jgi:hypothetical protein
MPRFPLPARRVLLNAAIGAVALGFVGAHLSPQPPRNGPVLTAAVEFATGNLTADSAAGETAESGTAALTVAAATRSALDAFADAVRPLSHPRALEDAFRSYFAYKAAHPKAVTKPYLYFVDYGLPSTQPRGYVFDMQALAVVDGPFTVAHGRGSSPARTGVPTRFSNASGSAATSLGLYLAQELYGFRGKMGGGIAYSSIGLRLKGLSTGWNDNARARGVVAHGAPYVTASGAGRSEGCPAVEPGRAEKLLPKLANGGMVFLFAPDETWMRSDPWLSAADAATADVVGVASARG